MEDDHQIDICGDYDAEVARWYTYRYGHIENVSMRGRPYRREFVLRGDSS